MILEKIDLYEYFRTERTEEIKGFLHAYRHGDMTEMPKRRRPALLLFPGGSYLHVAERESEPPALWYFGKGFDVFILEYDTAPLHYPTQIVQAGMAMLYLRREEKALNLNDKIAALGFSAGGHLCGCISFLWDDPALSDSFGKECEKIRPEASIFAYPVVTSRSEFCNRRTFENFCKDVVPYENYSLERKVRPCAPPCFLWTTSADELVPVQNSVLLYRALISAGVSAEFHAFEKGSHGMADCSAETARIPMGIAGHARHWLELSAEFLAGHEIFFGD